jgi:hypothetical protein
VLLLTDTHFHRTEAHTQRHEHLASKFIQSCVRGMFCIAPASCRALWKACTLSGSFIPLIHTPYCLSFMTCAAKIHLREMKPLIVPLLMLLALAAVSATSVPVRRRTREVDKNGNHYLASIFGNG